MTTSARNKLAKSIEASRITLTKFILAPELDETTGCAKPGVLLYLADDAAYAAAMRHSNAQRCSTGSVFDFEFFNPQPIHNDLLMATATVIAVSAHSMLIHINIETFSPPFTNGRLVASGYFIYVVVEASNPMPPLTEETPENRERLSQYKQLLKK